MKEGNKEKGRRTEEKEKKGRGSMRRGVRVCVRVYVHVHDFVNLF